MATNTSSTTDPSQAQAAQIPLQSFTLPTFPPEAGLLKALTLTSDIKLDEYQSLLSQDFSPIPPLPPGIESLTLELFSLGYPDTWLTQLGTRLPNIKSLVVFSQLLGGISASSQQDAINYFEGLRGLRALHLLDVFAQKGFFEGIAPWVTYSEGDEETARRGLMFLEVNYTVQHTDSEFLAKVQATELPRLIGPGLISCALNVSEADETDDPEDPTNVVDKVTEIQDGKEEEKPEKDGIMAFNKTLAPTLVEALTSEEKRPRGLRVLNSTLYTLTLKDLEKVLKLQTGLMVLIITLEVDDAEVTRKKILELLPLCKDLEQVEIVVNPSLQFFMAINNPRSTALEKAFPSSQDMENLEQKCEKISSFAANVLRSKNLGTVNWEKKEGKWHGGATKGLKETKSP